MALDFPPTAGKPTDGSFTHTENTSLGSVTYAWSGVYWYAIASSSIDDLNDVEITDAQEQDILVYNGAAWLNEPDLKGGTY
jgi:hypothetical protein